MDQYNNKDLGFILLKLQNSITHNNLLKNIHEFIVNRPHSQIVLFNSYCDILDNNMVPILHLSQAKFFYGNMVTMDLSSLYLSTRFINLEKVFFYATYIPWMEHYKPFAFWKKLFDTNNIEIIAHNKEIADIFEIVWKKPICISEEFTYEKLQNIL